MRTPILVLLVGLSGCAEPPARRATYSPPVYTLPAIFPGVSTPGLSVDEQTRQYQDRFDQDVAPLMKDWIFCLRDKVRVLAVVSSEAAQVVVRAAFAACNEQEQKFEEANRRLMAGRNIDASFAKLESDQSDQMMLDIVKLRAARPRAPHAPPLPPASAPPKPEQSI